MHFTTETQREELYYVLRSARNVMRKQVKVGGGGRKDKSEEMLVGVSYEMRQRSGAGMLNRVV